MGGKLDFIIMLVPLLVGFYTLTFARWNWKKKNRTGAMGVALLAVLSVVYPAFVLFFVHR